MSCTHKDPRIVRASQSEDEEARDASRPKAKP